MTVSHPVSPDGHSPLEPASPNPAARILISPCLGLPLANRSPLSLGLLTAWPWAPTHPVHLPKSPTALRSPFPLQGRVCRCSQSPGPTWGSREEDNPGRPRAKSMNKVSTEEAELAPKDRWLHDVAQHQRVHVSIMYIHLNVLKTQNGDVVNIHVTHRRKLRHEELKN